MRISSWNPPAEKPAADRKEVTEMTRKAMYTKLAAFSAVIALLFALSFADTGLTNTAALAAEAIPEAAGEETALHAAEEAVVFPEPPEETAPHAAEEAVALPEPAEENAPQTAEEAAPAGNAEAVAAPEAETVPEEILPAASGKKEDLVEIEDSDAGHVSEALTEPFDRPEHTGEAAFTGTAEIRLENEGMLHYGDEITLKAEVRDANMNYHLVWEASDNDGRGWYAVGSGERYSFFLNRENIGREYRVSVIAVD